MLGTIEAEWRPYMQTIADMGYTVIAVDWPGHAQSEMTKSFTFRVLVEELDALFKHLKTEPAVIFGYSMGRLCGPALLAEESHPRARHLDARHEVLLVGRGSRKHGCRA
jgi:pimeloyl-ACP methyl ester carboxylesterase